MALVIGVEIPDGQLAQLAGVGFDRVPEILDDAGIGYVVSGADRADGVPGASVSPTIAATVFARRTHGLGLVAAASVQRDHPFNIARRVASLDHLSVGRAGWLALRADRATALGSSGAGTWARTADPLGASHLADSVRAARALWRTWPIESLSAEDAAGDAALVRYADHTGIFPTTGPLNVPTTPQGEPVVFWRHEPGDDPRHAGAADVVIVTAESFATVRAGLPDSVRTHVRLNGSVGGLRARVLELAGRARVDGVVVRLDLFDLPSFLDRTLPALVDSGAVSVRAPGESAQQLLRTQVGVARRVDPDLSRHRPVFA